MNFSISEALSAFAKGCSSAVKGIQERVLPTPGKRKRDEMDAEAVPPNAKVQAVESKGPERQKETSVSPPSQFARAAAPPMPVDEPSASLAHNAATPGPQPSVHLPGISAYAATGQPAAVGSPTPIFPARHRRTVSRMRQPSIPVAATPVPWQQRYSEVNWPRQPYATLADRREHMKFTPFARKAQAEGYTLRPGSALWNAFQGGDFDTRRNSNALQATQAEDLQEKEMLRGMTEEAMRHRPVGNVRHARHDMNNPRRDNKPGPSRNDQWHPRHLKGSLTAPNAHHWSLKLPGPSNAQESLQVSVARYELEQAKEKRQAEETREETKQLLEKCKKLLGEKQADLLQRADAALGESKASGAAEISRASMQAASREAEGLKGSFDEPAFLEKQRSKLEELRKMRQTQQLALSTAAQHEHQPATRKAQLQTPNGSALQKVRSAEKPAAKPKEKALEEEVVDLISSDDEGVPPQLEQQEAESEAEDEGSQQSTSYAHESEEDEEELLQKLRDIGVHERHQPPQFKPLTAKQKTSYQNAMNPNLPQNEEFQKIVSRNIYMTRRILSCLRPRTWLNDEVVNGYLGLLQERDQAWRQDGRYPKCHIFTTFFFNRLFLDAGEYCYKNVRRWTLPKKLMSACQASKCILDCDRLIAPVHLGVHWTCAAADLKKKEFLYLDSMGGKEPELMESFRLYVSDEYLDKKQKEVDTSVWPIRYPKVPHQQNGCDCGVFATTFAEHLSRGANIAFDQSDMPYFRVMITAALMALKAPSDFES